ncbi:MAG: CAP domain-containing protein [Patescibacteria group bacterium]|jgi:uncharacterized protein YkwD
MEETEIKRKVLPAVTIAALFFIGLATVFIASASEISPENIISAINRERESVGLSPLTTNQNLNQAAYTKSSDMLARNYFEHYAYGLTPWMFIIRSGYEYSVAGENLAKGFSTSEDIVKAWMKSPTHRQNILNPEYQDVGVGVVQGVYSENGEVTETTLTTEMAAKPKSPIVQFFGRITAALSGLFGQ